MDVTQGVGHSLERLDTGHIDELPAERKKSHTQTAAPECKVKRGLAQVEQIARQMREDAADLDRKHGLPSHHVEKLKEIGYPSWNVPEEYGGLAMPLTSWLKAQELLAQANPSVALGMGWHMSIIHELAERRTWPEGTFAEVCRRIVHEGGLLNRAVMEVGGGSPSRGGKTRTTAKPIESGGYVVSGRKTFTTFAPLLEWFIVTAALEDSEDVIELLIPHDAAGVSIEWTWNMAGMRGTASHDLVLEQVKVTEDALLYRHNQRDRSLPNPYLLHIPACYLGIATAARDEAIAFATAYTPPSLSEPIASTPNVERYLGEIELEWTAARRFLYGVAKSWEVGGAEREALRAVDLAAAKVFVVQAAQSIVDKAMRIVGAYSLRMDHPLQRMYRDVRFGLHNPPMEDIALTQLARASVQDWKSRNLS
ncbi:acyl-CoA dehydrogenase family protein [Paenibacillus alvei]|uniref:acyl-CoA dehydrogenase family protein n=1 Tax=Paenibacillus alvei TaxID=44250 RepID=UPI001656B9A4|nr:acyl-CoA dehydrogenase family protein [Paenibacillus alvei]MCY9588121.1 acyl-CoA/acyl-ACP dehydrogenase [Paenibacillus alvei]